MRKNTHRLHRADELLNRIWYAGAYTNQMCTIDPHYGNALVHLREINSSVSDAINVTWWSNYTITNGSSALVDGAKRDRIVWAGGQQIPSSSNCDLLIWVRYVHCRSRCCGLDERCDHDSELFELAVRRPKCNNRPASICWPAIPIDSFIHLPPLHLDRSIRSLPVHCKFGNWEK